MREAHRLAIDGTTRGMDGRKSLLNREGNGKICFLCMNLQKKTCLILTLGSFVNSFRSSNLFIGVIVTPLSVDEFTDT